MWYSGQTETPFGQNEIHLGFWATSTKNGQKCSAIVKRKFNHLLDVADVLEIFHRRQLYAKSSKCEFGRQVLGFLCHRQSSEGMSVDPRKVQSIVEWATPWSCAEVCRTRLANYYRPFVEDGFRPADNGGLLLRRDAPARRTQSEGIAVATRIRGRRRPRFINDPDPELFFRLGRDAPAPALPAANRVGCAHTRRAAAAAIANVQEGDTHPSTLLGGGGGQYLPPPCTSMFIDLAGWELQLSTGTMQAPPPPVPSNDLFL